MNILDKLAEHARERVAIDKAAVSYEEMKDRALSLGAGGGERFTAALKKPGMSFICEVKKASPSKGVISEDFPYMDIAREYEAAGADCMSCLTEPKWFLGSDEIFTHIRGAVATPMIRKDFTVDEYQIYQARVMGADAVLLICAILDTDTIAAYLSVCRQLGLAALVEAHDGDEIRSAVAAGADIIGVNNRNLKDFTVDFSNAERLRELIPADRIYVAESGVSKPEDAGILREMGADAALIGEMLMRSADKATMLKDLRRWAGE